MRPSVQDIARECDESLSRAHQRRAEAKRRRRAHVAVAVLVFALVWAVFALLVIFFPR